jgi:adenosylcobinamide kinase/adenosylcobinamide-phosphate guanylyltransferase
MERLRALAPAPWTYLATGEALDDEMKARISRHQSERGDGWITKEESRAPALEGTTLVDCLTLWISNRIFDGASDDEILTETARLCEAARPHHVVMVTNEVGQGLVPETPLGRRFRDLQGWVNQRVAQAADEVWLVACGLPLRLK